ncbi:MAG: type II secretion system F family protein [Armatimonadota bacterium]|nr:type II secretion system F family protein [Armatimonadota bacterium]MDR7463313.1 type II secretion system F family protein [Armatimonadota bacterium]MDR7468953.1 type II secretion system F family protein [Armatimonadota bacterium]MDR7473998.1 type II secretion system F family protein [Armatimonadota bacterium]MDR7537993.1 type II secretion system F family protein [Armatimonadota bacterium]
MWPIALLVFVGCFSVIYLVLRWLAEPRLAMAERLARYASRAGQNPTAGYGAGESAAGRLNDRLKISRSLDDLLDQADLPLKSGEFVLIAGLCALGLSLLGKLAVRGRGTALLAALLLGIIGVLTPLLWARLRKLRRRAAFNRQLPDALQTIANSLRAGHGFTQGMAAVANDLPAPISAEFARALREMNLGSTVEDVLMRMAYRMQSLDFDLAVSGILINRQIGGNLAELLDHITATIRERVFLKNFIRVRTAQQRLSAIIIAITPAVLLAIFLIGVPEYMSYLLFTDAGRSMLAVSLFMQLLGAYFLRRIVAIDV